MSEEEIIEQVKWFLKFREKESELEMYSLKDTFTALEEFLNKYNNLKAIEQEHQKINGELREEIKREREKNKKLEMEFSLGLIGKEEEIKSNMGEIIEEYYISKDKIREKIEEVKSLGNVSIADMLESEKEFCIDILEELLEK